jgi:hypothetical protein
VQDGGKRGGSQLKSFPELSSRRAGLSPAGPIRVTDGWSQVPELSKEQVAIRTLTDVEGVGKGQEWGLGRV